jgi:D-3-phosphoglycerate dehydrogenase
VSRVLISYFHISSLYFNFVSTQDLSLPKEKINILLLEGIHPSAVATFQEYGYTSVQQESKALSEEELLAIIPTVHILGIRSRTLLSAKVIAAAERLIAVGCFCIGTNQVDLTAAKLAGIPVFNAPFSNTRSVAELTIGHIIHLLRGVAEKNTAAHQGQWLKTASGAHEARGKTLGIIGYGRIGTQVSILAEALGMNVLFYDPVKLLALGNATAMGSLDELLEQADIITLHVPQVPSTKNMIGKQQFAKMKPGSSLINLSRGNVVDIDAVVAALQSGHLRGAAFDVFPAEPDSNDAEFVSELRQFDNVILTPHIGGSTLEAQENIGKEVASTLATYSDDGSTTMSVNFPSVDLPPQEDRHRLLHIHRNQPGTLAKLNELLGKQSTNIAAQYLQTDPDIGYVVTDLDHTSTELDIKSLKAIPGTIKTRILY